MKVILFPCYNFDYEYLKMKSDTQIYEVAKRSEESTDDSEPHAYIYDSLNDFTDDLNYDYIDLENNFVMFVNV